MAFLYRGCLPDETFALALGIFQAAVLANINGMLSLRSVEPQVGAIHYAIPLPSWLHNGDIRDYIAVPLRQLL